MSDEPRYHTPQTPVEEMRAGDYLPTVAPHLWARIERIFRVDDQWIIEFHDELVEVER